VLSLQSFFALDSRRLDMRLDKDVLTSAYWPAHACVQLLLWKFPERQGRGQLAWSWAAAT